MSLKDELFQAVKTAYPRTLGVNEVEAIAHMQDKKVSNAERRLRELCDGERPLIRTVRNEKGYITGYRFQSENELNAGVKAVTDQDALFSFNSLHNF